MLNFKHLHYFWVVAKQGSVTNASESLHVTPQTISGQIHHLEREIGHALFAKAGRGLQLTAMGKVVYSYADEIFTLGDELVERMRHADTDAPVVLRVGISESVPKTIASRILQPVLQQQEPIRLVCKESNQTNLLAEMALHNIDMVLADGPIPNNLGIRGFNHELGTSRISFLAAKNLAKNLSTDFPACLDQAPMLIPSEVSHSHLPLLNWLNSRHLRPKIVAEFDDSALLKAFGRDGVGVFPVPSAIAMDVCEQFQSIEIGCTDAVMETYYAITNDRQPNNPAIELMIQQARAWLVKNAQASGSQIR